MYKKLLMVAVLCAGANAGFIQEGMQAQQSGDHKKLIEIYEKACHEENKASGCYNLAVVYFEGTEQDYAKAKEFYEKSCNLNYDKGCNNLAIMYAEGKGVAADIAKAKELFDKSCAKGLKVACENAEFLKPETNKTK